MTKYEYQQDHRLIHRMKQRLAKHLGCSYGEVSMKKKNLVLKYIAHPSTTTTDQSVAEYMVVVTIANEFKDWALVKLMHLYSVGYFKEDTEKYNIKTGENYEIINRNYLNAVESSMLSRV